MSSVIPAPFRVDPGSGELRIPSVIEVEYRHASIALLVERFCREAGRRSRLRFEPKLVEREARRSAEGAIRIAIGERDDLAALPATTGVSPVTGGIPDERYALTIDENGIELLACEPVGVARGLTTLLQLLATAPASAGTLSVPAQRILDAPRFAWRSFSVDVARRFLSVAEVKRLIDLLALYKFNVLNLHLTEDAGWRLPFGRPPMAQDPADPGDPFYSIEDLRELIAYADERFITLVPELDAPGHATAIVRLRPELLSGRNRFDFEAEPGRIHVSSWFDPELPATFPFLESVWSELAELFPSSFINIGGDEPFGMPHELYVPFIRRALSFVRSLGKQTMGWQESIRAGADPDHLILHWISIPSDDDIANLHRLDLSPELVKNVVQSREDIETAVANGVPMIISPHRLTYLDVPYAEPSADPAHEERRRQLGLQVYPAMSVADMFNWDPGTLLGPGLESADIAGVGSAIWGETISGFDDLVFLVLPRLAGNAHKAWSEPRPGDWDAHRDALAAHGRLWEQDDLGYFRSSLIAWR
ncbi:MAG: family 20 glycosylhydrolase [Thermomicrobiales bacterium]|nr:family 20 glycosylhydrolase [Thermomicrobiales bacterium]